MIHRKAPVLAGVLLFTAAQVAYSHLPENETFGAFQWPSNQLPVLDGDISEWDVLPDELWVTNDQFGTTQGIAEHDASDFFFRVAVGWNDEMERIYFASERYDDVYDRNGDSRDDTFEFAWDTDHSGGDFWRGDLEEEAEIWRNRGSQAQSGHFAWPEFGDGEDQGNWFWFWMTALGPGARWASDPPWACCDNSFTIEGSMDGEATLYAEWYVTGFDDYNYEGPDESVIHDLVEGEVIGIGMSATDTDEVDAEGNVAFEKFTLGGENLIFGDASFFSDFLLLEVNTDVLPTAVENDSWGRIKASYEAE